MTHTVRRIGALVAVTAAALAALAYTQATGSSTGGPAHADSVWRVTVTPTPDNEPNQDAPVIAPRDSVW